MKTYAFESRQVFMGRLARGDDLLRSLTQFCKDMNVRAGWIQALGAVEKGSLGFYDQATRKYQERRFDCEMEIASLVGNVSLRNGEIFLHCHAVLSDPEGKSFGGHLNEGTIVFACEFSVFPLLGPAPVRTQNEATGLMLWD